MRLLAPALACTLMAQPADLDRKLWIQNLLLRQEKARDEGAARVRATEALVAKHENLVARTGAGSLEAQATARKALEATRAALQKRRQLLARADAAVARIQQALKRLDGTGGSIQALPLAIRGEAWVVSGGTRRPLGPPAPWLEPGDTLETGPGSRVELEAFGGQAALVVGPESRLTLPPEVEPCLDLGIGKFFGRWKAKVNARLTVRTPPYAMAIRGTQFLVEATPEGGATCLVLEGLVAVSDRAGRVTRHVEAGQRLSVPAAGTGDPPWPEPEACDSRTLDRWWEREEAP